MKSREKKEEGEEENTINYSERSEFFFIVYLNVDSIFECEPSNIFTSNECSIDSDKICLPMLNIYKNAFKRQEKSRSTIIFQ